MADDADNDVLGATRKDWNKIFRVVDHLPGSVVLEPRPDAASVVFAGYTTGIPARQGAVWGSGSVQIYQYQASSNQWIPWQTPSGAYYTATAFNLRLVTIPASYVVINREQISGKLVVAEWSSDATAQCTDENRAITDIRWESPTLQYRKGTACSWVDILTGTTCDGPTAAPSGLASTGTTTTSVSLSWTDNSSNEDGFVVEYKTSAGSTWTVFETTAADATTSTVTGLTAGTSYDFRVAATNVYGQSSYDTETGISTAAEP